MNKYISTFVLALCLAGTGLKAQVTEPQVKNLQAVKHRVVIQLSSNDTLAWKGLMNNLKNLKENILPTRPRADLILKKGANHLVEEVALRKL